MLRAYSRIMVVNNASRKLALWGGGGAVRFLWNDKYPHDFDLDNLYETLVVLKITWWGAYLSDGIYIYIYTYIYIYWVNGLSDLKKSTPIRSPHPRSVHVILNYPGCVQLHSQHRLVYGASRGARGFSTVPGKCVSENNRVGATDTSCWWRNHPPGWTC